MNKNQKKILKFLAKKPSNKFFTIKEISDKTGIEVREVGSECYKLREIKYLEAGAAEMGVELSNRITVPGQNALDNEDHIGKTLKWKKIGIVSAIILSSIIIIISLFS